MPELKVLAIGDIVGSPGRRAVAALLPRLAADEKLDFVVANAENAAGGSGLTPAIVAELLAAGCGVLTSGDHVFKNRDVLGVIDREPRLLRPANFPKRSAGRGWGVYEVGCRGLQVAGTAGGQPPARNPQPSTAVKVAVINLLGRSFMGAHADNPFERIEDVLAEVETAAPGAIVLVDFHAEATAEKVALGRQLDGRAAAVWGTHTHVPTADETVLPGGTGYITDLGMTGPHDSIIGRQVGPVLSSLVTGMPERWDVAVGDVRLSGAIFTIDPASRKCAGVRRAQVRMG
ncbi:MAG TPA: TIGR00282 family metallophosphoesterase [Planctomycetota bacterium]|nr:TIGR00282 family metallophosphoesterase [Planctomycetota bacterium]